MMSQKMKVLLYIFIYTISSLVNAQGIIIYKDGQTKGFYPINGVDSIVFSQDTPLNTDGSPLLDSGAGPMLTKVLQLVSSGASNVDMTNAGLLSNLLTYVETPDQVEIKGVLDQNSSKTPCISIIDDDPLDGQIPSSMGGSNVTDRGGYFSLLASIALSLEAKYNQDIKIGLACEGHRVGLTKYNNSNDDYSVLNENGNAVKKLNKKLGWEILCHSMTAQLPARTYGVESLDSELANQILAEGTFVSKYSFQNTIVLDKSTGKWYEVNKEKTAWFERTPTKKYAQLYYKVYGTNDYHINRNFDFDYSWGEWFKRAKQLGLPFVRGIVFNGNTTSPFTIANSRRHAEFAVRTHMSTSNSSPIPAAVGRYTIKGSDSNNALVESHRTRMMNAVDYCLKNNTWLVLMSHAYEEALYNGYRAGIDYPQKEENYPTEWYIPLNREEILTMDENNYWVSPPARLGISSWAEWYPAPGTQLSAFYDVLEYAIGKGIKIVLPSEGWNLHGNKLQLGVDMNGTTSSYSFVDEFTDEEQSYVAV